MVSYLLPYGFELAMAAASFLMFLGGVIVFVCLTEHPSRVGESAGIFSICISNFDCLHTAVLFTFNVHSSISNEMYVHPRFPFL